MREKGRHTPKARSLDPNRPIGENIQILQSCCSYIPNVLGTVQESETQVAGQVKKREETIVSPLFP